MLSYPGRMILQRRLCGIYTFCFLIFMIPRNCKLFLSLPNNKTSHNKTICKAEDLIQCWHSSILRVSWSSVQSHTSCISSEIDLAPILNILKRPPGWFWKVNKKTIKYKTILLLNKNTNYLNVVEKTKLYYLILP